MKITCLGGGPGGLYLAMLAKKDDPSREVTVIERNQADQTFGWGVVFSDETLSHLAEADRSSFDAIERAFARWQDIDIFRRGKASRSTGHGFAGIARKRLLAILQARCLELGVTLRFGEEVADIEGLRRDSDLLVAADGLSSRTRARYAESFRPSLDVRKNRYIWLGTTRLFDAFTFAFEETPHGIFNLHAYRFDEQLSTFIVECPQATFERAGLESLSMPETLSYLERLFAARLEGHRLRENRAAWINFTTVRNESWRHENVTLLGDAAHTAHFSIGSGTKLALEDAIALANSLRGRGDVGAAIDAYDDERRGLVARTQKAAGDSLDWFENVARYIEFDDEAFDVSLLTRSKRITYENLRLRDPGLVERATARFSLGAHDAAGVEAATTAPPPMFTPLRLRGLTLANRVVVSPMCMYSAVDGVPNDFHVAHLGARALGGAGLVMTEMTDVSPDARITLGCAGLWSDDQAEAWRRIVELVHATSEAKLGVQLGHAGRKGSTRLPWDGEDEPLDEGGWELIAPSAVPYKAGSRVPREMTRADMDRVRDDFVGAARRAARAGFDLLELHFAHGYLLATFLSPLTNHREDEYGGSLASRMRYPLEVFDAVRAEWPSERPMSVRISATDWVDGGFEPGDAVEVAAALKAHGVDIVDVSSGQTSPAQRPVYGRMWQSGLSDRVRNEARVRTITVGNITTHDQVNSILAAGRADLCALARPHLDDPAWTLHAAREQGFAVRWPSPYAAASRLPRRPPA